MRCDEAFQHLTRAGGQGAANGRLERHLAQCGSCRETAELFRPAVALFERGGGDQAGEVPAAWRRVWEAVSVAEQSAAQLRRPELAVGGWWRRYGWPACTAAALLIGVLAGVVVGNAGGDAKPQAAGGAPHMATRTADVSCDALLAVFRQADGEGVCPTCRRPVVPQRTQVVSLCAVCHLPPQVVRPANDVWSLPSRDAGSDTAQSPEPPATS